MRLQKVVILAFTVGLVSLLGAVEPACAGAGSLNGGERDLWSKRGGYSLIVARVGELRELPPGSPDGTHSARLRPLALLAGTLDPSGTPSLAVRLWCSRAVSSVAELPPDGATVLAVVKVYEPEEDERDAAIPTPMIVGASCEFMPGRSALVAVTGLADPEVERTLARVQEARAKAEASPVSATRPTSAR